MAEGAAYTVLNVNLSRKEEDSSVTISLSPWRFRLFTGYLSTKWHRGADSFSMHVKDTKGS